MRRIFALLLPACGGPPAEKEDPPPSGGTIAFMDGLGRSAGAAGWRCFRELRPEG